MTKYFGALVGTPKTAVPPAAVAMAFENSKDQIIVRDRIELGVLQIADQVELARTVPWETVLDPYGSDFSFDDLGGVGITLSIGDVTFPAALCNAQDVTTAAGTAKVCKSVDLANYFKPLWAMLGYASLAAARAIGPNCTLYATIGGGATTAGTVTWQIRGARRM